MIVVDLNNIVLGSGPLIERVNENGEENLIKVWRKENPLGDSFYIGTLDRDLYSIYGNLSVPDTTKNWKYIDGEFVEFVIPPSKEWVLNK